ncbi:alpha/beta fold hydrolase [Streptomyces sp. NL15-2K]|uniref:alpha/beta fold hydrolase n=1 Tax=Streptomyces sp. NL15-2K TaxID=376149 RepID=UPI002693B104
MPTITGTLTVPGTVLHYQVCGSGPLLLISQSREGDADRTTDLVTHLTDTFTVVTYDRRGLSRSRLHAPRRARHWPSMLTTSTASWPTSRTAPLTCSARTAAASSWLVTVPPHHPDGGARQGLMKTRRAAAHPWSGSEGQPAFLPLSDTAHSVMLATHVCVNMPRT